MTEVTTYTSLDDDTIDLNAMTQEQRFELWSQVIHAKAEMEEALHKFVKDNPQAQELCPIAFHEMVTMAMAASCEEWLGFGNMDSYEAGKNLWWTLAKMVDTRSDEEKKADLMKAMSEANA